jgi:hypothetical protein
MERHDSMTRAVRFLLGAGTFAAALVAITANSASAQTQECLFDEGGVTLCGHVFTDGSTGAQDVFDLGEGTPDVDVYVTDGEGNVVAVVLPQVNPTPSNVCDNGPDSIDCGYYKFTLPEPPMGVTEYWVCIVLPGESTNCADADANPEHQSFNPTTPFQIFDFETPSTDPPSDVWGVGTGTPGYWKNHPEAWPADGVTVGGVLYQGPTIQTAIKLMGKVGGDKSLTMFASLISAKLNSMLANNTTCIASTIGLADVWMAAHPAGSGVKASSPAWIEGEPYHQKMDDYNNGKLCAPHRD